MRPPDIPPACPRCGAALKTMLLLGVEPDGYVCTACRLYYTDDLKPIARVIGGEEENVPAQDT
jgi:hypothetical protein